MRPGKGRRAVVPCATQSEQGEGCAAIATSKTLGACPELRRPGRQSNLLVAILRVGLKFSCIQPNCVAIRRTVPMLKFAIAAGIVYEWLFGATVSSLASLEFTAIRTLCATLLAWMVLESARTLFLAAMSLDNRPIDGRRNGAPR
jgi:hypothetical protein